MKRETGGEERGRGRREGREGGRGKGGREREGREGEGREGGREEGGEGPIKHA